MFHKAGSSVGSGPNRKSMDVPLRKSDRRALHQVALELFPSAPPDLLHAAFLEGSLVGRKILHPSLGKVNLYYRSPSTGTPDDNHQDSVTWPFVTTTLPIWMTVDVGPTHPPIHCPTVALLAVFPQHFPAVLVPSAVSKFLCRGAHLMRAGIHGWWDPQQQQQQQQQPPRDGIVCIKVQGNPQPFAIGRLTENTNPSTTTNSNIHAKGVGVEIWTCYGDDLWKQSLDSNRHYSKKKEGVPNLIGGASYDNGNYGNVGFIKGMWVKPIVAVHHDDDDEDDDESEDDQEQNEPSVPSAEMATVSVEDNAPKGSNDQDNDEDDQSDDDDDNGVNPHDVLLHSSVCNALVNIKDSELPMTTATLYAQHVLSHRPPDTTIQLKLTSWKKFGTYLAEQVNRGLVQVKPQDKNPMGFLIAIQRDHEDLRGYRVSKTKSLATTSQQTKIAVVNLYVVPHHFIQLLRLDSDQVKAANAKGEERRGTGMLTVPEARAILDTYVTKNELLGTDSQVMLDGALTDALYKRQPDAPTSLSRKDLANRWIEKMEAAYALVEMPGSRIRKLARGTAPLVSMEVSLRQGKKFTTRVRGLEEFGIDPSEFVKDVARRFACAGTMETEPEGRAALKKGYVELVFQGHLVEEIQALLLGDERLTLHGGAKGSDYCLPKSVIDIVLRKGVPAKKKR